MVCSSAPRPRSFVVLCERFFEIAECLPAPCEGYPAFLSRAFDDVHDTGRVGTGVEQMDDLVEFQPRFTEFGLVILKGGRELCGGGQPGRHLLIVNSRR